MKLQAVMENLQRQQRARLQQEMESRQQAPPAHQAAVLPVPAAAAAFSRGRSQEPATTAAEEAGEPESARIQRAQMAALAAMREAAAGLSQSSSPGPSEASRCSAEEEDEEEDEEDEEDGGGVFPRETVSEDEEMKGKWADEEFDEEEEDDYDEDEEMAEEEELEEGVPGSGEAARSSPGPPLLRKQQPTLPYRGETSRLAGCPERLSASVPHLSQVPPQPLDHGDWTYEEQFKQIVAGGCARLRVGPPPTPTIFFVSFSSSAGTPVNRIPIMAKQVLDLYMLYVLVTEKGGLVEVINKKLWREITKGLNLPTSITSAAFTLRTQYMKYLYPYECEKRGLSNPNELQAAIDSNRREGRRQGFSGSIFTYSPSGTHSMLSSPKLQVPTLGLPSTTNGSSLASVPKIKKEEDSAIPIGVPGRLPVTLAGHPAIAAQAVQAAAAQAAAVAQAAALEHLREKLESGEPPEKKMALVTDEQQRLMQRALQQNLLAMTTQLPMSIRINSQGTRSPENRQDSAMNLATNGTNSINMSVELNGIVYTGVLFAQTPGPSSSLSKGNSNSGRSGGSGSSQGGSAAGAPQTGFPAAPTSTSTNSSSP
ncbi:AT-rich interactive domain-containing protein 3A [Lacerta agilis]|uniref:AT-rich interactive domain-containing protein 3A n=1 Tax=Lacerta agilis TaxID=80427 RepID=UPI00141995B4|nr:AT-rich interactive domain-containing protein 3A [Lacerta agilis]